MRDISRKISENYKTIKGEIKDEFEIEKSVFITNIKYVESEDEAISFIEKIKEKYKDATHNCHAYIINEKPEIKDIPMMESPKDQQVFLCFRF